MAQFKLGQKCICLSPSTTVQFFSPKNFPWCTQGLGHFWSIFKIQRSSVTLSPHYSFLFFPNVEYVEIFFHIQKLV